MTLIALDDWRNAAPHECEPLYAAERRRWLAGLAWDTSIVWRLTEAGRSSGALPGLVARDERGTIVGWTYFALQFGLLRIGALQATRADVVRLLLDAVLDAPEASTAKRYQAFLFPEGSALESALQRRRFETVGQRYLERPLSAGLRCPLRPRRWESADETGIVRLLPRAYAGERSVSAFAPEGRREEWSRYVADVVRHDACGAFAAPASFVMEAASAPPGNGRVMPEAVILTTWLSEDTVHVAQLAVDPPARRRGLAAALLAAAASAAADRGAIRQTLVVADHNDAARGLYASCGFVERARLLFASRDRITRPRRARPSHEAAAGSPELCESVLAGPLVSRDDR